MNPLKKNIIYIPCLAVLFLLSGTSVQQSKAQNAQVFLELQLSPNLTNSQAINLTNILANNGRGTNLFSLYLQNENMSSAANNLYFNLELRSEKQGLIADMYQQQGKPFSLDPGQQIYATNNQVQTGLPGVEEQIDFDGGLTPDGEEFVNDLGGSTKLPADRYIVTVELYQGANKRNGGIRVASSVQEFGGDIADDDRDIFLTSPGDVVGSGMEITNPYPEFRWEGSNGTNYRLIVVEAKGQDSPESLIQGALSTEPILNQGAAATGSLLDYEILDARARRTSFQMPPSGVQKLEPGKLYFWQVQAELNTSNGVETRTSEIWSFRLAEQGNQQTIQAGQELARTLRSLLGNDQYRQLAQRGFRLQSIVIDGQTITGPAALQQLVELKSKLDAGDISIIFE